MNPFEVLQVVLVTIIVVASLLALLIVLAKRPRRIVPVAPSPDAHLLSPGEVLEKQKELNIANAKNIEKIVIENALYRFSGKKFPCGWAIGPGSPWTEESLALAHERLEEKGWKIEFKEQASDATGRHGVYYYYGSAVESTIEAMLEKQFGKKE